jgi:hypothetical protein
LLFVQHWAKTPATVLFLTEFIGRNLPPNAGYALLAPISYPVNPVNPVCFASSSLDVRHWPRGIEYIVTIADFYADFRVVGIQSRTAEGFAIA